MAGGTGMDENEDGKEGGSETERTKEGGKEGGRERQGGGRKRGSAPRTKLNSRGYNSSNLKMTLLIEEHRKGRV